ncbi:MAG: hypothetical protein ACRDTH_07795 [Pseudonocardiaceae bacterium]
MAFIEFGPAGHAPIGVTPASVLPPDDEFVLFQDDTLTAIGTWKMDEDGPLESVNDIAVDGDRRMLAISSRSRCIARLGHGLDPDDNHAKVTQRWELPKKLFKADDARAEGLLVDPRLGYLVAIDSHDNTPNLFRLDGAFERQGGTRRLRFVVCGDAVAPRCGRQRQMDVSRQPLEG